MAFGDIPIRVNNRLQFISAEWWNTIRTELIAAFGSGGYVAVAADQAVAAGAEITVDSTAFKPLIPLAGDGAARTTSTTPFGTSHGFASGKEIILLGTNNTNTLTLEVNDIAGGFISSRGKLVLSKYKQAILIYNLSMDRFILQE